MIRFWVREMMGWILVVIGLFVLWACVANLLGPDPYIFEAPAISIIGIMVFRGGIHLLKVALAARVCMKTQTDMQKPTPIEKRPPKTEPPWDW